MWTAALTAWQLLFGMALLLISNGLLVTLLTLRGLDLGMGEQAVGLLQSAYPIGAIAGCVIVPRLVASVGHVRTFGALASIASCSTLIHLLSDCRLLSSPYGKSFINIIIKVFNPRPAARKA